MSSSFYTIILLACALLPGVRATALDNGVVSPPQVICSENSITFNVRTSNIFRGNIYIKGQYSIDQCRREYRTNDFSGASFTVNIGSCGMRRIRQLQPLGMTYMVVFLVNFHPQFVTKVDRAYNVRCFYAQADKTVTQQLDISMLSTQTLEQATAIMPNCQYSVRDNELNGAVVRFARVGDKLVHRWECDNPSYGMLVKNCFVSDGAGSNIRVLDSRGCPVFTPVIQAPLQYDNSLNLAFTEIWAYKFPDRSQLVFQCQIQICNKRDNECVGVTPPNCPLVLKQDFNPSSTLNTNSNPNIVSGTFGGGGINSNDFGGSFNVDPTNTGLQPIRPINLPGSDLGATSFSTSIDNNNYGSGGTNVGVSGGSQSSYSSYASGTDQYGYGAGVGGISQPVVGFGSSNQFSGGSIGTGGLQPARPYSLRLKDVLESLDQPLADQPIDDDVSRQLRAAPTAAENLDLYRFLSGQDTFPMNGPAPNPLLSGLPQRQLANRVVNPELVKAQMEEDEEDTTLDVIATPMYVVDTDEPMTHNDDQDEEYTPGAGRSPPFNAGREATTSCQTSGSFCVSEVALWLIISSIGILLLVIITSIAYITRMWMRKSENDTESLDSLASRFLSMASSSKANNTQPAHPLSGMLRGSSTTSYTLSSPSTTPISTVSSHGQMMRRS